MYPCQTYTCTIVLVHNALVIKMYLLNTFVAVACSTTSPGVSLGRGEGAAHQWQNQVRAKISEVP